MTQSHTPTPWYVNRFKGDSYRITQHELGGPKEDRIADGIKSEANAAFIVRACNSHDALVAMLSVIRNGGTPTRQSIDKLLAQAKGDK